MKVIAITVVLLTAGLLFFAGTDKDDGKKLFIANCAACHHPQKTAVGPPFQYIRNDYDVSWITAFVRNGDAMVAAADYRAVYINAVFNRMAHQVQVTDKELKAILDYVDDLPVLDQSFYTHRKFTAAQMQHALSLFTDCTGNMEDCWRVQDSLKTK